MRSLRQHGFTLIELLVSLTIFALIATASYSILGTTSRIWERTDEQTGEGKQIQFAFDYLRRQISKAIPVATVKDGDWVAWFDGNKTRLRFLVNSPSHAGLDGYYEMTLLIDSERTPPALDMEMRQVGSGKSELNVIRRTLVEGLQSAEFDFFASSGGENSASWHPEWSKTFPRLVRLRMRGLATGEWPELIIRLPADEMRYHQF